MTINQLQYLEAVARHKNFSKAAEECHVSQPALSMQIKLLEDELKTKIFDRSQSPIRLTAIGKRILKQSYAVLFEVSKLAEIPSENESVISGKITLGIIPTLAPYLLPLFIKDYTEKYPDVHLDIRELTTDEIIAQLSDYKLDIALMATPIKIEHLIENPIFYENMLAYVSPKSAVYKSHYALAKNIDPAELWLLEEGHCLRTQIIKLCELKKQSDFEANISFQVGSIETLIRLVDKYQGITILPELATLDFGDDSKAKLRPFSKPAPQREISLVHHKYFGKSKLIESLVSCILENLPEGSNSDYADGFVMDI